MSERVELGFDQKVESRDVIITRVDAAVDWMRKNSVWPLPMGLACCGIELMAVGASRFDIARFGAEVMRFSPRQADLMIVAGTCVYKMAGVVRRVWDQMAQPKYCMAMGACASTGGMFRSYAVVQGVDRFLPVDVYISGCPPRPEAVLEGLIALQNQIQQEAAIKGMKSSERSAPTYGQPRGPIIIRGDYAPKVTA
ncbi:MAG: NADH-quinone oxidoreductase subunit NuoB [Verrucomicrobiota bacterium]|jgi:NADH-quinone oxidoreductase subunit B